MIRRLHLENFKCLRDVTVDFAPLTVLIGPNDSGKSSILEALHLLSQMQQDVPDSVFPQDALNQLVWRRESTAPPQWDVVDPPAPPD